MSGFSVIVDLANGRDEHYPAATGDELLTVIEAVMESKTWTCVTILAVASPRLESVKLDPAADFLMYDEAPAWAGQRPLVHAKGEGFTVLCGERPIAYGEAGVAATLIAEAEHVTCPKCLEALSPSVHWPTGGKTVLCNDARAELVAGYLPDVTCQACLTALYAAGRLRSVRGLSDWRPVEAGP